MFRSSKYLQTAVENEKVFRNILRDLKINKNSRPMGRYIPRDLDSESGLEEIYEKYSKGNRTGVFSITDFRIEENIAVIGFMDVAPLSGGGASLMYEINENKTVLYLEPEFTMMS